MSVVLIAHYLGPRLGIGQYFERLLPPLVKELTSWGTQVKIFASPNAVQNTPALQQLGDCVSVLPPLDYPSVKRYAWFATRFSGYCRREGVEAVIWLSNPIILPWHPPTIAVIHDVNEWKVKTKYGNRMKTALRSAIYLDASLHFAKQIIVVSQATKSDILHFRPEPKLKLKLKVIPNGSDSQLVNLPSVSIPTPAGPFLLSVGRIDPSAKRLPEAVALVSALREASKENWELHLVGGMNASTQASGEAFLSEIEHLPWVQYHGYIDDCTLAEWYRKATAVVFLSDNEGFGFPIAEAASFGHSVIVSQTNQAGIEAGGNAIISVATHDPHGSADEVLRQLQEGKSPGSYNSGLPQWQSTASAYAEEICAMLSLGTPISNHVDER